MNGGRYVPSRAGNHIRDVEDHNVEFLGSFAMTELIISLFTDAVTGDAPLLTEMRHHDQPINNRRLCPRARR